jgi:hypothetical protein
LPSRPRSWRRARSTWLLQARADFIDLDSLLIRGIFSLLLDFTLIRIDLSWFGSIGGSIS